jgi:hypothetical protein
VSGQAEYDGLALFAGENPGDRITCIAQEFSPRAKAAGNISLHKEADFLSGKEIDTIDEASLFFSRNWYKFGKEFEKEITFQGICLGLVSDFAIFNIFKRIFLAVKAASNAAGREKAKGILSVEQTLIGECAKAAAKEAKLPFLGIRAAEVSGIKPGFSRKKVVESAKKLFSGLKKSRLFPRSQENVVFVRSGGYLNSLSAELDREPGLSAFSLDDVVVRNFLNPFKLAKFSRTVRGKKKFFAGLFARLFAEPGFREKLSFQGVDFSSAFERAMYRFSGRDWPEFVFAIGLVREEFEKRKPCALVVWEDWIPFEKICVLVARQFETESLVVQHGLFRSSTRLPDWVRGFAPVQADKIAVWGPHFRRLLISKKVPADKIMVTGAPRFDAIFKKSYDDPAFRKSLGLGEKEGLVVLATQPYTLNTMPPLALAEHAIEAVREMPGTRLAIKIHPLESKEDYKKLVEAAGGKAFVVEKTDLYRLLHCAKAVIVHSSTVGIEALMLKRPLVVFAENAGQSFFQSREGFLATNGEELKKLLAKAMARGFDAALERLVCDIAFKQDGRAGERLVGILKGQKPGE